MIESTETTKSSAGDIMTLTYSDGKVSMDKRVYEQKLGTLLGCLSANEAYEVAMSSSRYIKEKYQTDTIVKPIKW